MAAFLDYAQQRPDVAFELTAIGCGLAGYSAMQIAPMFAAVPMNVQLPEAFAAVLTPLGSSHG